MQVIIAVIKAAAQHAICHAFIAASTGNPG